MSTLYNRHWIECGILTFGQILTDSGKLDVRKLMEVIINKRDLITTQAKILKAIEKYRHMFRENDEFVSVRENAIDLTHRPFH